MPEIKLNNVLDANKFLQGKIERTPLLTFDSLSEFIGFDVYFKAELFQKTGSFKIRGILNKLRSLNVVQKKTGVVAMSAGDHAVSLAIITSRLRIPCVVILPTGAVKSKMSIIKKTGARIIIRKNNLWDACIKMQEKY
ncbi:MAG: pyridoxal-phosphate dependent enzyme, partial [Candidatus Omnitrophica bacterium]|nr:pyridoxal-phosphate dependent enzyme [Candidatus Omnitrophota bacterium]